MNLNDLRMSLKAALDNMWARIDARIHAIEEGGGGGGGGGVTGVKGDAESSYRQGNVNLTPANIGALAVDGSNAMHNWIMIDTSLASSNEQGLQIAMSDNKSWFLYPTGNGGGFTIAGNDGTGWFWALSVDMTTKKVSLNQPLDLTSGGTGATTAAGARANLGCNDIGIYQAQSAITPVNDGQTHNITISADCWVCVSLHVTANVNGVAAVWRNGIPVVNNANTNGACNYWANAQFPCKAGGLLQYMLSSNATDSYISFLTV